MANPIFMLDIDPDGIVATHPARFELPVLVAPIPEEQKASNHNTIRPQLVAIGCFTLPSSGFAFDSSVVSPRAEGGFTRFARLMIAMRAQDEANPKRFPPCAVFGHADPTGSDEYNKTLSGRRARAVYAVLVRDVTIWEKLYAAGFGGDQWGLKSIQTMLSTSLARPKGQPPEPPFYTGPIDGKKTPQTSEAISAWLTSRGFKATDTLDRPGDATRRATLFREYMDALCHTPGGEPFLLDPVADFLARRKDKGLRGDVMGCGEFNPKLRISKRLEDDARKSKVFEELRNEINEANRRVVVYAFDHGSEIDPNRWPCPSASDGPFACTLRLWSDHAKRRGAGAEERVFGENMAILTVDEAGALQTAKLEETGNTMGCRFYHGFAVNSPCEAKIRQWVVRFRIDAREGRQIPLAHRRYVVQAGEAQFAAVIRGATDEDGEVRIPVFGEHTKMTLRLDAFGKAVEPQEAGRGASSPEGSAPGAAGASAAGAGPDSDRFPDEDRFLVLVLDAGELKQRDVGDDLAVRQRLYNLGFGENAPAKWTAAEFDIAMRQYRHRRNLDSAPDAQVRARILEEHDIDPAVSAGPDAA
jgi:peptidoglycan hydrolase-like protein with peptidoglycan-binding domain